MSVLPDVAMVAKHILDRTKDADGNLLKTFTDETYPDAATVTDLIQAAYDEDWADALGVDQGASLPEPIQNRIREAIAVQTAVLVELSVFRDQLQNNVEAYRALADERNRLMAGAIDSLGSRSQDGGGGQLAPSWRGMSEPVCNRLLPNEGYYLDPGDGIPRWVTLIWDWPPTYGLLQH